MCLSLITPRQLRELASRVTGLEHVTSPSPGVVQETVRNNSVSKPVPGFDADVILRRLATTALPFGLVDDMWLAFSVLQTNKTPTLGGDKRIVSAPEPLLDPRMLITLGLYGRRFGPALGCKFLLSDIFTTAYNRCACSPAHWDAVFVVSSTCYTDDLPTRTPYRPPQLASEPSETIVMCALIVVANITACLHVSSPS